MRDLQMAMIFDVNQGLRVGVQIGSSWANVLERSRLNAVV
jgi:hypothetical protein